MHPAPTTLAPVPEAASSVSIESCFAFSTKPHVFTSTTSACDPSVLTCHPSPASRAANSSESTSLRAQPNVSRATVFFSGAGTRQGYRPLNQDRTSCDDHLQFPASTPFHFFCAFF